MCVWRGPASAPAKRLPSVGGGSFIGESISGESISVLALYKVFQYCKGINSTQKNIIIMMVTPVGGTSRVNHSATAAASETLKNCVGSKGFKSDDELQMKRRMNHGNCVAASAKRADAKLPKIQRNRRSCRLFRQVKAPP